ncbi:MAG: ABC transporter permease [Chitinispirillaceae bacterium]|nr:ABC transporter permease [Chitinispirillaceae bacterium]
MSFILSMAWRNIGRNRRRTLLAVISVTLSIMLVVFMKAFVTGFVDSMVRNYTRHESGHIRITTKRFAERSKLLPVDDNVTSPDSLITVVRGLPEVGPKIVFAAERFMFGVLMNNNGNNKPAMAIAGDPQQEKELSMLYKSLLPGGKYCEGPREMIMGGKLAGILNYTPGDTVGVMCKGADDALRFRKFHLTGLFKTNINSIDERVFQIGIDDARALLRTGTDAQQIVLFIDNYRDADAFAAAITSALGDTVLSVQSWTETGPYYQLVKMSDTIYNWLYGIIALLGAFIISNIMMMVVLERRKEIGILKSMGMKQREILALFLTEGVMMGVIGSVGGVLLGTVVNGVLSVVGIDFSKMMSGLTLPMDNVIYPQPDLFSAIQMFLVGTAVASLVALLPSRQAAKMNAVEAIKSV